MILWKEYQRIKDKDGDWSDTEVRTLLSFCWELQLTQYKTSEELKKALDQLTKLRGRIEFYRQLYPIKGVKNASN
jgi:hypothetical protein